MEEPNDRVPPANPTAVQLRVRRRWAIALVTALLGPLFGALVVDGILLVQGVFSDRRTSLPIAEGLWQLITFIPLLVAGAYLIASPFALAAAALNAWLVPMASGWKRRLSLAFLIGFAVVFVFSGRLWEGEWFAAETWLMPGDGLVSIVGGIASTTSILLVDYVSALLTKRKT
jgi:hypothetical protein